MTEPMARMLGINLTTKHWGNKRKSRVAEQKIDTEFGSNGATDVRKYLIPKHHLSKPEALISALYRKHYKLTLPWLDKLRVIPTDVFFENYLPMYKGISKEFKEWREKFVANYPIIVQQESERMLNTLFNPADYPTAGEMKEKFSIDIVVMPVPTSNDFRVDSMHGYINEIKEEWEKNLQKQGHVAQEELWSRLVDPVEALCNARNKKRFDESLVDNIINTADLVQRLNVFGDTKLDDVTKYLIMSTPDISTVKNDPEAASVLGTKFKGIVSSRSIEDLNPEPAAVEDINDRMAFWAQ